MALFDPVRLGELELPNRIIGFARHYIGNPDLDLRLRNDWPLAPSDRKTYYGGGAGYADYPAYDPGAAGVHRAR
jgi:2,4-dienoyl-CoA reductase-like NADH-dependent reductase (Old Yellow Enzyme family)